MDATSLEDRFVVLAISVVYRGCAVPVAWKILKAEEKHAWKPELQALLKRFKGLLPEGWTVIVLADRGLYAKWLFEHTVNEVVGSGNTHVWMTRLGRSDCGWQLLSLHGGYCLPVANRKLKPTSS